jgi:hypothetical protein
LEGIERTERDIAKLLDNVWLTSETLIRHPSVPEIVVDRHDGIHVTGSLCQNCFNRRRDDVIWIRQDGNTDLGSGNELLHGDRLSDCMRDRRDTVITGVVDNENGFLGHPNGP